AHCARTTSRRTNFGQTCDEAVSDRVNRHRKDDRDDRCRLPYRGDSATDGDNDVDLQPDKLGRDFCITFGTALRPAILDRDFTILDPPSSRRCATKAA